MCNKRKEQHHARNMLAHTNPLPPVIAAHLKKQTNKQTTKNIFTSQSIHHQFSFNI